MAGHHFISYSSVDAADFVITLCDELSAGPPPIRVWLDQREIRPGQDWDEQIVEAIRTCESLIFIMTPDGVDPQSVCKQEWTRALSYKKPIIPILRYPNAEMPFRLGSRQYIDFTDSFDTGLARLRRHLQWLASPEGQLQALKYRLADAQRDLRRARDPEQQTRIQDEMDLLQKQIAHREYVIDNPQEADRRVEESIQRGLERERKPEKPVSAIPHAQFINPPPAIVPTYFQDRHIETKLIGNFLMNNALRLITVVGRGGIGKTAMVCRLLKSLESGRLPDDGEHLSVDGIVYLSEAGSHQVNVPKIYADLCRLLPDNDAEELGRIYKNPQATTEAKMYALLEALQSGRYVLLLDNFENVIDPETRTIRDPELDEALRAVVNLPQQAVKVILTTRFAPYELSLVRPERQARLDLDEGLPSPYAENILREMDVDGKVGLKTAPGELLAEARRRTGGNPRALEALFAILSADRSTSLREILDDTEKLPGNVVEVLVGEAFSRLDTAAQMVMQALAIYGHPVPPAAVDYLLKPHLPGVNSAPVLNRLVNMQFARKETGHYYLHQVDYAYALSRVPRGEMADWEVFDMTPFTQFALLHQAANYFEQTRTPRETWKTIEDLAPQLAEFDLRCAGEDYDKAASVLLEIDFEYLQLWGHSRLVTKLHERLQGKLNDPQLQQRSVGNLGSAYFNMGRYQKAKTCYEQALEVARQVEDFANGCCWLGNLGLCYATLGNITHAIDHYERALEIARRITDRSNEGWCLGSLGGCYATLGKTSHAIEHYQQALEIAREIGDRRNESAWLGTLGSCYGTLGQTSHAIEHYQQALKIAREIGDRRSQGNQLGNLGSCYATLGQMVRAIEQYEQALEIAREIGDRGSEVTWIGSLGGCYFTLGQTEHAIDHYEQALETAREIGLRGNEGICLGSLGGCYYILGQVQDAIDYYDKALEVAREIGDWRLEGAWLGELGGCYHNLGQTDRAIDHYEQALKIAREVGDRYNEGTRLGSLGYCYHSLGQVTRAIEYYKHALEIAREIGNRFAESVWLGDLGYCHYDMGQTARAIDYYEQALKIAREIRYLYSEGVWLGGLGNCYYNLGQIDYAIAHYQQALKIAREIGDQLNEGWWLGGMGTCYYSLGQTIHAKEYYKQALKIAREIGDRRREGWWLSSIGNCYYSQGPIARAKKCYEQALGIAQEIKDRSTESTDLRCLGALLVREDEFDKATQQYKTAINIADAVKYSRVQNETRVGLAQARLYAGDLTAARTAAEAAQRYDYPLKNANLLALLGVISLRQGDSAAAQETFESAIAQAEELLSYSEQNYAALDSKGLALCGLALCEENGDRISAAIDAYRAARTINKDVGIVGDVLRLFDELAREDSSGMLAEVRAVAAGE